MTDDRLGPTSRTFFSQRLRLHYVDWGNPDAPPLLLLHGGRDHCRNWDWVAEALRNDHHVIAPDLRGHGESAWSASGHYTMEVISTIWRSLSISRDWRRWTSLRIRSAATSRCAMAASIPRRCAGWWRSRGWVPAPGSHADAARKPIAERMRGWIDQQRASAGRQPRRYPTLADALARMQAANKHLRPDQARHLTQHGVNQNEDGTYSWKFDHYVHVWPPYDMTREEIAELWGRITCPTLLVYGKESWAGSPARTGGWGISATRACWASKGPGIGCTMTGCRCFWMQCGGF